MLGWLSLNLNRKPFNRKHTLKEPNKPGIYTFYDEWGRPIYVGRTAGNHGKYGIKHRISSYHQKDSFIEHPTKKKLRPEIKFYSAVVVEDKAMRRAMEKELKKGMKHNHY